MCCVLLLTINFVFVPCTSCCVWKFLTMAGGFMTTLYNTVFKRTSTFAFATIVGAVFLERFSDAIADGIFESANKGRLWKDIKHNYE